MLVRNKNNVSSGARINKIPCTDCKFVYIDETSRNLDTCIEEHKYAIRATYNYNAIFKPLEKTNHRMAWENSHLSYKCRNYRKLKMIEAVYKI